jgi:large subunit ribosomal protein L35
MPKIKTHKATAKRYYFTGKGKIMRKKAGQDHFNARESGRVTKRKRRHVSAHATTTRTIKILTQHN